MAVALRSRFQRRAPEHEAEPDNRLSFFDQAAFASLRATGRHQLIQGAWIYEHPIDMAGLRRFHANFAYGLFGRLIERSPLPFGRDRWVSAPARGSNLDIGETVRPRAELSDWLDERTELPVDPEYGPGWHMGVQSFTDGSTAVSLVGSHCLCDGIGAVVSAFDAVNGTRTDFGHPPAKSRPRPRAVLVDAKETVRGAPEIARTVARVAKLVVQHRHDLARAGEPQATDARAGDSETIILPSTTIFVPTKDWDARAESLGGNSYSLVAGFGAKLAERIGRRRAEDGAVTFLIAINDRTPNDIRAHALGIAKVAVDPIPVTEDLSGARAAVKEAITTVRAAPDEALQILPLIPFIPKRMVKRLAAVFVSAADLPVSCSNVGELPPQIACLDGTEAEYCFQRGVDQHVTREDMERDRGQLVLVSSRTGGKIAINILAYQPGAANSKPWLRELASRTLAEFGLNGTVL